MLQLLLCYAQGCLNSLGLICCARLLLYERVFKLKALSGNLYCIVLPANDFVLAFLETLHMILIDTS